MTEEAPLLWLLPAALLAALGAIAALVWVTRTRSREAARLRELHPDEPWRWRPEWARGRIRCDTGVRAATLWGFGSVWSLISAPLLWILPAEIRGGNQAAWLGWLFPLVGIGLLAAAAYASWRLRRFGRSTFEMTTLPGVIGGELRGTVHLRARLSPEAGFGVRLTCLERTRRSHGGKAETQEHVRWQAEQCIQHAGMGPWGSAVPVSFTLPSGCLPSAAGTTSSVIWTLEVEASVPGVDYRVQFEVPVFITDHSRRDVDERQAAGAQAPIRPIGPQAAPVFTSSRVRGRRLSDGTLELLFPAPRSLSMGLGVGAIGVALLGAALFMAGEGLTGWLFALPFGAFGLLLVLLGLDALLASVRLRVRDGWIERRKRLLGIGRTRVYAQGVSGFRLEIRGQVGRTPIYALCVNTSARSRPCVLADHLRDKSEARGLEQLVEQAFGSTT
jgi:hypothetical protein